MSCTDFDYLIREKIIQSEMIAGLEVNYVDYIYSHSVKREEHYTGTHCRVWWIRHPEIGNVTVYEDDFDATEDSDYTYSILIWESSRVPSKKEVLLAINRELNYD